MTALLLAMAIAAAPAEEVIPAEHLLPVRVCVLENDPPVCVVDLVEIRAYTLKRAQLARALHEALRTRPHQCASLEVTEPSKAPKLPLIVPKEKD